MVPGAVASLHGGLGLRSAKDHAAAAYITSVFSSEPLKEGLLSHGNLNIDLTPATNVLSAKLQEEVAPEDLFGMSQKAASLKVDLASQLSLTNQLTELRDKARLASLSLLHAGDWLNVIPSPVLGLHVHPQEFRFSILYRLGAPLYTSSGPCPACGKHSDVYGDHAIVCGSEGERIARHNHLRDSIFQSAASANLAPRKEEQALLPGNNDRPADVLIPHWSGGRDTVVSPLLPSRVAQSAENPGHTLAEAFTKKYRNTYEACEREGIVFVPAVIETLGGFHELAIAKVKKITRALARSSGRDENEVIRHQFQKMSVLLVRGNAALFLNRIPNFAPPEIDGAE